MSYIVYILKSVSGEIYKGLTSNLKRRLMEHKSGHTKTTRRMSGIEIIYTEKYDNLSEARKREKYLKSAAGRRFLKFKKQIWTKQHNTPLSAHSSAGRAAPF